MADKITLSSLAPSRGSAPSRKRTGGATNPGFEGGQMPMYRRLPKRGFTNPFKVTVQAVNLGQLKKVTATDVSPETLYSAGLIGKVDRPVKLLGTGDADRAYTVRGVALSASARAKIEAAGGKIEG
jgi:large subunit ribosomal protein L15